MHLLRTLGALRASKISFKCKVLLSLNLGQWQISVKVDKYIKLFLIRSDSEEGGIACFVLVLVPAILTEEALFVKLEVLRAALLSHLLRLLEVKGNIAVRWT